VTRYRNLGGDSGVIAYEIEAESITVEFMDSSIYLYNYTATGQQNVDRMKVLAEAGRGLNSFINTYVRKAYSRKLR